MQRASGTIPWTWKGTVNNWPLELDLEVTYEISQWSESHPYGSTTAREYLEEILIENIEYSTDLDFKLQERITEELEEDLDFRRAVREDAAERSIP